MPLTPPTMTRLDPATPLLWRDGTTLQLGEDGDLRFPADAPWVERLLSRMRHPFRRSAFDVLAYAAGAPRDEARRLLARVEPLLQDDAAPARAAWTSSLGLSDERTEYRVRESLADQGVPLVEPGVPGAVAVVVVPGAAAALAFASHMRADTPHLPVAFQPGRVTVGPLVLPGSSPCLACRDAHDTDRDPAWPLLHSQLIGADPGRVRAVQAAEAGMLAAQLLAHPVPGRLVRFSADGERVWRSVTFHAECLCRAPSSPSLPGSETVRAPRALPTSTRTAREFARPA